MSNGRDDTTKIDFTVADRLMIQEIHTKISEVINIKDKVIKHGAWISVFKWGLMVASLWRRNIPGPQLPEIWWIYILSY